MLFDVREKFTDAEYRNIMDEVDYALIESFNTYDEDGDERHGIRSWAHNKYCKVCSVEPDDMFSFIHYESCITQDAIDAYNTRTNIMYSSGFREQSDTQMISIRLIA